MDNLGTLYNLRSKIMRKQNGDLRLLLANFQDTKQKVDIEKRNSVVEDFFRIKIDVKPWRDAKDTRKDNKSFDWNNKEAIMDSMTSPSSFDMPSWVLYNLKNKKDLDKEINKYCEVFIYQLKGCNLHCPYCFVDDFNKNGKYDSNSGFFSMQEIIREFELERIKRTNEKNINQIYRIRASGGEPSIVPEQWLSLLQELDKRGLSRTVHVQSDTNLTTGHFLDALEENNRIEKNILNKIAEYKNFSLLCSFKGTDKENFSKNTGVDSSLINEQMYSFEKLVNAGIDVYPFFYNPNPKTIENFMENLEEKFGSNIYAKIWTLPLKVYEPVRDRLKGWAESHEREWKENYELSEEKMRKIVKKKTGLEYKKVLRTGFKLKAE